MKCTKILRKIEKFSYYSKTFLSAITFYLIMVYKIIIKDNNYSLSCKALFQKSTQLIQQ